MASRDPRPDPQLVDGQRIRKNFGTILWGGHVRPASRVPPARPRRTREAPQAAGPGGGAEFVTEPRDHHIEDSPLSREFESTGDAVSTWDCSLYGLSGGGHRLRGVSAQASSQFAIGHDSQVKRHYIKLHTCITFEQQTPETTYEMQPITSCSRTGTA